MTTKNTFVHINIGSNSNKEKNIAKAIELLKNKFKNIKVSKIYKSKSVGFEGEDFFNVGVNLSTTTPASKLAEILKNIEDEIGRVREVPKFSDREIDLDIIFYGDKIIKKLNIPRDDILKYQFVLTPFMEITTL